MSPFALSRLKKVSGFLLILWFFIILIFVYYAQDMGGSELDGNGTEEALPPPPPIPPHIVPIQAADQVTAEPAKKKSVRVPMARRNLGTKGQKIPLLTNHFRVKVSNVDGHFFHYSVCLLYFPSYSCLFFLALYRD